MSEGRMLLQGLARSLPDTARGLLRPRQPTGTELAEIRYVEPPAATAGVRVRVILQTQWDAPTAGVIEGQLSPAMTTMVIGAFVVEHPSAMFFADAGICADAHTRHLADMPAVVRKMSAGPPPRSGLLDGLREAGIDPSALRFALLTHVHWDHVSGLAELPGVPARISSAELPLVAPDAPPQPGVSAAALRDVAFEPVPLDGPPVLTFPASHDVFGDGSVLLCDLAGHTPGHVGILLALRSGRRLLLAGDAVWNSTQLKLVRQRPAVARLADADPEAAYRTVVRLSKLPPEITVVPAHDHDLIASTFPASGWLE
ncbi:MAG TPA: MBL fold metallo-hydrolase [Jatrophihabitantaceae bacterium]|jgi:glyoxylase-like metal-dependent hydrolase (beta-lactamase superfamily II)|nr:MBL fold metallo-hydrolase [Jatrophihabitantaceae bacterium]